MRPDTTVPAENLADLSRSQAVLTDILLGRVSFGNPANPQDPTDTTYAGAGANPHNGTLDNIEGSFVEIEIDTVDNTTAFVHNLGAQVVQIGGVNQPNVRWLVLGLRHTGTGVGAASTALGLNYDDRDAASITANSFPLRLYGTGRTINAVDPVKATVFFITAIR